MQSQIWLLSSSPTGEIEEDKKNEGQREGQEEATKGEQHD